MKWPWRLGVVTLTIFFIYLLFPILIVPSSLPAIQETSTGEVQIFQLEPERVPTLKDRVKYFQVRHRQGREIIAGWIR